MKQLIAGAVALMGLAGAASAATLDFTNGALTSGTIGNRGYTVTASVGGILNGSATVTQGPDGLGVNGFPDLQPGQIDGSPVFSSEALTVSFTGGTVNLDSYLLGLFDSNDDYTLSVSFAAAPTQTFSFGPTSDNPNDIDLAGVTSFTIRASGQFRFSDGFIGNDDFTLASVSVSAVPLPAGAGLLLGALGLLGVARRRKAA